MKKINIKNYIYPLILLGVVVVLFITNYKSGTFLTGIDNFHIEFNLHLALERTFFSAWEEFQGVGLLSALAHASELPRLIFYYILSFIFPLSIIRYFYTFLSLLIGVFGVYYLVKKMTKGAGASMVSAMFYMLNLVTVQVFFMPTEMFITHYAFLPWLIFITITYLESSKLKHLLFFNIFLLLSLPQSVTPTLFITSLVVISIFVLNQFVIDIKRLRKNISFNKYLFITLSVIIVNFYWASLFVLYSLRQSMNLQESHTNRIFSQDTFLQVAKFGNLWNLSLLKGVWFGYNDSFSNGQSFRLMSAWISHFDKPYILSVATVIFVVGLVGVAYSLKSRLRYSIPLLILLLLTYFMLTTVNFPTGVLYKLTILQSETLSEAYRFSFTKFSILFGLLLSIYIGIVFQVLAVRFPRKALLLISVFMLSFFIISAPIFQGNFIYRGVKNKVPDSYFQVFKYFKENDKFKRVASLPQDKYWAWQNNLWGYRGSGFLWYGIEQPILDRAFDVWNHSNEQFYDEFQYAVYSENPDLLSSTFQKYDVGFLILDKSIIAPGTPNATFIPQTKKLLASMPNVTLDKTFGDIEVYKVNLPVKSNKWVVAPEKYINTKTSFEFSNIDSFSTWGLPYVNYTSEVDSFSTLHRRANASSKNNFPSLVDFPFADDNKLAVAVSQNNLQVLSKAVSQKVVIPNLPVNKPLAVNLSLEKNKLKIKYIYPKIVEAGKTVYASEFSEEKDIKTNAGNLLINGKIFTGLKTSTLIDNDTSAIVFDSKLSGFTDLSNEIYTASAVDCGGGTGEFGKRINQSAKSIQVFLRNKNSCVVFNSELAVKKESVVKVEFEYKATEGSRPLYCLTYNDLGGCLNQKYENAPKAVGNGFVKYLDYVYVKDATNFKFLAILESDDKQKEQSAEFKNIVVTSYNVLNKISLAPNINAYNIGKNLQVAGNVRVVLPDYSNLNKDYKAGDFAYNSTPKNCDNFNETSFDRKFSLGKYTYSAEDAISCDTLDTANINTNSSYLIDFVYKNIEGKGLDLCFASGVLQKCMLQDRLLTVKNRFYDTGSVKTESFILPSYPEASKIQINIGNQSIGRVKTVNELYSVNTKYIPYEWLKEIYTMSSSQAQKPEDQPLFMVNSLEVLNVKKTQTYKYDIETNGKSGLLVLNQSFDKGWVMYKKESCLIGITSPLTCFSKVKEHNLVSNWANGWFVNDNATTSDTKYTIHNTSYIVLFWPQYMQFAGYFVLGLWIVYLLLFAFRKRLTSNA